MAKRDARLSMCGNTGHEEPVHCPKTTWEEIMKAVYQAVRHNVYYGSPAWMSTAKTKQNMLDQVQN